ncbi:hypothetical protein WJX82_006155 [Trebouxia sp. C0006]
MEVWNATFTEYLTEQLQGVLNCSFTLAILPSPDAAYVAVENNQTDFLLVSAGLMQCIQVVTGISPVASLVNWVGGEVTYVYGGCVYALASRTNITSLRDLVDTKIALGPFSDLPAFEIQTIARNHDGISMLGQASQILFNHNSQQGILDLLDGNVDVAIARADVLSDMQTSGLIQSMDLFKCITEGGGSGMVPGYPFPITTSAWPELALAAHPNLDQNIRKAVAEALFGITQESYPAIAGDYSTWVPPYSYASIDQLEENVGYKVNGTCLRNATLQQLLLCPAGQESLPADELADHCQVLNITCPAEHTCYCRPCRPVKDTHHHQYGLLGATAFTIIIAVVPALVVLGSLSLCLYLFQRHSRNKQLLPPMIPFSELKLSAESDKLFQGTYGLVLKGTYCGVAVAVCRVMPASSTIYKSIFGVSAKQDAAAMRNGRAGTGKGRPRRASASRGKSKDRTSPLLEAQGPLLANYSQSFIEQLRTASSPYAYSTGAAKRRLSFSHESRLQSFIMWLSLTFKRGVPLGAAAAQRRQKSAILRQMAQRMQLRHPNLATVLGVSCEPVTGDPLLAVVNPERGLLKYVLHNETLELETEMVIAIMKDVASALKYLHHLDPPILDKTLTSYGVMLTVDYCAQLVHLHHADTEDAYGDLIPYWKAPELLKHGPHTMATDIYAFGMLLYEVLFRRDPYAGESSEEVLHALCDKNRKLPKRPSLSAPHGRTPPAELVTLMQQCWHQDPEKRPLITEVKDTLLEYARLHFKSRSPAEAMAMKHMKERALLDQILPPKVSAALREGRPVEPESFDCVTIFFSDIVGFKTMSTELPPQEVMSMLDRLYRAFDVVTSRHNLFKVETIGDSYMVVGNLRCPQPDHAARVAYFAIEAVQTAGSILISESKPDMGHLSIRAGFHSGPVVASVVGTTNPRYCLFGDTVNVASRMGSSSIANRIHITSSAAALISAHAPELGPQLVHRRMQQIKGKGVMRTFWLELFPDHLVRSAPDGPDHSAHTSRTPLQASQAGLLAHRIQGPQDPVANGKSTHEGGWSSMGSRLSSVSAPLQVLHELTPAEPSSPDPSEPMLAKWPRRSFEGKR